MKKAINNIKNIIFNDKFYCSKYEKINNDIQDYKIS